MIFRIPENQHRFMRLMNTNLKSSECTFLNQLQLGWNSSHFFICNIILFILCTNAPSINFYKFFIILNDKYSETDIIHSILIDLTRGYPSIPTSYAFYDL